LKLTDKGIYAYTDPAAENAILAIIDDLILDGYIPKKDFLVYTNNRKKQQQYKDILDVEDFNENKLSELILKFKPTYIFLGTSLNEYEHNWRKLGVKHNIKVISFIDHWTNYVERFSFNDELIFGNEVRVVNEIAKKEAIRAGVPEKLIVISGNPYYKKVKEFHPKILKKEFFHSLNINIKKKVILFISDDIKRSFPSDLKGNCTLGFDEYSVLSELMISLTSIDIDLKYFQLILKLHPKSDLNKFEEILKNVPQNLNVITIKDCDSLSINYFSDYVIGMFSNMVIESYLMNKNILRIQIGQKNKDLLKYKKKYVNLVKKKDELDRELLLFLNE
tara:strand:- start:10105 stop:11106 length:1002 start_codon:yes stop_codon:yes gene_type:complete